MLYKCTCQVVFVRQCRQKNHMLLKSKTSIYMSWFMSARRFPCPSFLAMVVKPAWAWLQTLGHSTFHLTHCKWQPPGWPFGSHLAMGLAPAQSQCMHSPPKISIKGMRTASLGSLSVSCRLGHFIDHHISHRHHQHLVHINKRISLVILFSHLLS